MEFSRSGGTWQHVLCCDRVFGYVAGMGECSRMWDQEPGLVHVRGGWGLWHGMW